MPIRLNLLSEAHAEEEARRKDPVKRAILAGIVLVSCVLGWSSYLQLKSVRANAEFASVKAKWDGIEKSYQTVIDNRRQAIDAEEKLAALQRLSTNRFLWGTALHQLQHLLNGTEGITLTRIRGEQTFIQQADAKGRGPDGKAAPSPAAPGAPGKEKEAAKGPSAIERIVMTLDARDASAAPGDQVAKLKTFLSTPVLPGDTRPRFTNQVALLNISAPQTTKDANANGTNAAPAGPGSTFVTFTLQSSYPERTRQ